MQRKRTIAASAAVALLVASGTAWAQGQDLTGRLGTLGVGAEIGTEFSEHFDGRLGVSGASLGYDVESDNIDYDADLRLFSVALLLDWRPNAGNFRISTGLLANNPEIEGDARANGQELTVGGTTYRGDFSLEGETDFPGIAPYLGLGWDGNFGETRWGWSFDHGLLYQGEPDLALSASGQAENVETGETVDVTTDPDFQRDLDEERDDLEDELASLRLWPVVTVGVSYRF